MPTISSFSKQGHFTVRKVATQISGVFGLVFVLLVFAGCDGPFIAADKTGPPEDHVVSEKGAMHKEGLDHPFLEDSGCSDSDCHNSELTGGLGLVDEILVSVPSCYQCHGEKWDDDEEDSASQAISGSSARPVDLRNLVMSSFDVDLDRDRP